MALYNFQKREDDGIKIAIDGLVLTVDEREQLAKCDGFGSFAEMMSFWEGRLPFQGDIVHWHFPPEVQG